MQTAGLDKKQIALCIQNLQRNTSFVSNPTSSLCRDTPTLENTRFKTFRAVSSAMPSLLAASRGGNPKPTSAATRASPSVSPKTSRTTAGSAGSPILDSMTSTIARACVRKSP